MNYCQICDRQVPEDQGLICGPCLNAELIIETGKDVNGNGSAQTSLEKLKLLIDFNWNGPYLGELYNG